MAYFFLGLMCFAVIPISYRLVSIFLDFYYYVYSRNDGIYWCRVSDALQYHGMWFVICLFGLWCCFYSIIDIARKTGYASAAERSVRREGTEGNE